MAKCPEPEVGITDRDDKNEKNSFSFEDFLGGVTQAALLRPDYAVVDDPPSPAWMTHLFQNGALEMKRHSTFNQ